MEEREGAWDGIVFLIDVKTNSRVDLLFFKKFAKHVTK